MQCGICVKKVRISVRGFFMGDVIQGRDINTLILAHDFLSKRIGLGASVVDATAGRGRDTLFLCKLVGETGAVTAFDLQEEALESTRSLLEKEGVLDRAKLILESHSRMNRHVAPESQDGVVFNFGYLPGGRHDIFTRPDTSIPAIEQGLEALKDGGVMSLCIYYGGDTGYEERDALMEYLKSVNAYRYTVLMTQFWNRSNDPAIPVFIIKG